MSIFRSYRVLSGEFLQDSNDADIRSERAFGGGGVGPQAVVEPTDVIPGNSSTPYSIAVGSHETGTINTSTDRDWFQVTLTAGEFYLFTVQGEGAQPLVNGAIDVFSADGTQLGHASGDGDEMGLIFYSIPTTGTYFVSVGSAANDTVGDYSISVDVSSPTDSINWQQTMSTNAIEVYFAGGGQSFNGETAVRSWTSAEITAAMTALGTYAAATGLSFTQTASVGAAELVLTLANLESGVLGYAEVGTPYVFFDPGETGWTVAGLQQGGYGFVTMLHEFGHALGLAHPHDRGGGSPIMPDAGLPVGRYGVYGFNQGVFTTMTYNDAWPLGPNPAPSLTGLGWQGTPMALDIALLQQFYGVNPNFNSGGTTYALSATNSMYRAIWDTGGIDTISFSGSAAATIDLRAATIEYEIGGAGRVSYVNGVSGGFTIAAGVLIENATGGSGGDTITGNSAANVLNGSGGNDTLNGLGGGDTLNGGSGDDVVYGAAGDTIDGGDGVDYLWVDLSALTSGVNWNAAQVASSGGLAVAGGVIRNVEAYALTTGSGADVFSISSLSADTYWVAGAGVDQFVGNFSASTQGIYFRSLTEGFELTVGGFRLQMFEVELVSVTGGGGDDQINGTALVDAISGNGGDDAIYGAAGDDVLYGNDGADVLDGGDGADTLEGGDGNDQLIGGAGADIVRGGAGNDVVDVRTGDWVDGGDGRDRADVYLTAAAAVFVAAQAA
ncbi:MAG: M10 family metallopeptidase C-terminal domain-containing protein, partial [Terricaulis sp.]